MRKHVDLRPQKRWKELGVDAPTSPAPPVGNGSWLSKWKCSRALSSPRPPEETATEVMQVRIINLRAQGGESWVPQFHSSVSEPRGRLTR